MQFASPRLCPLVGLLLTASTLCAQADWRTEEVTLKPRAVHTAAFDIVNGQMVVFGGNANAGVIGDTWLWSATSGWVQANPATVPAPRREHAMAYDAVNQRVVMHGGWVGNGWVDETWLWDGTDWTLATPVNSPGPRGGSMAFDPTSGNVILHGGVGLNAAGTAEILLGDTWAWNGTNWTAVPTTNNPGVRADSAMSTDWSNSAVVLFGGWANGFLADTWVWDGTAMDWVASVAPGPAARSEHSMASTGTEVVLFGGDTAVGRQSDTWTWNGSAWTQVFTTNTPPQREEHVLVDAVTSNGVTLVGGWDFPAGHMSDTWEYQAGQWTSLSPATAPYGTGAAAAAYDSASGLTVMFGGYQDNRLNPDTWVRDATGTWTELALGPQQRVETAMAYDPLRAECVLFGGVEGPNNYSDTWVFGAGGWTQLAPTTVPPARWGHSMAFDAGRGTVLMFGGRLAGTNTDLNDTWEWNGVNWTQLTPAASPSARHDSALAYDAARGEMVLFGGWIGAFAADTWVFRAGNWVALAAAGPSARSEHCMAYDAARERVVLFGGEAAAGQRPRDTWDWDGTNWVQRTTSLAPLGREEAMMVYDSAAGECVLFGGWDFGHFTDVWTFGSDPIAVAEPFGLSCGPSLQANRPWLGDTLTFAVSGLPIGSAGTTLLFGIGRASLPLDLIGMPGCELATSTAIATAPMIGTGSTAGYSIPLAPTPSSIGINLVTQSLSAAPGANALGVVTSNGLEITVGAR